MRRIVLSVAASTMTVSLAGCGVLDATGNSASASPSRGNDITVGLLLPEKANTRYDKFDYPIIKSEVSRLTAKQGKVEYANADADASRQTSQMQRMIDEKVDIIMLDAVDSHAIAPEVKKAKDAGIPVIAYDRLAEGPIDAYVSFDNVKVGQLQGQALLDALGSKAKKSSKIVMINGDDADPNAGQFKKGAHEALDGKVNIAYEQSGLWKDTVAAQKMSAAITQLGAKNIAGVYAANDGMAGGIANTLKGAGISGIPLTGQDAELAGIQRIVAGTQSSTVYKAYKPEADTAAELAVNLLQGKDIKSLADTTVTSGSGDKVQAKLLTPVSVTVKNIKDTVVKDGLYTVAQICTAQYAAACKAAGLQ
jgi:D-xylose transport system substrate-binding protein